ncbi:MAG: UDP-N-acetylmuramoyl-L-alanyl-D-glutamate--2,6-diaminopimelate ligase [Bacteroidia bacterium]|nr:UDP-N-acetylmuramoyl-L-alanyl-D-glutamate--2,6-diaminopimelate ligase [Bacteroidia bacterium]
MKRLIDILPNQLKYQIIGSSDREIAALHLDSRLIGKNDVFVAIDGTAVDGHKFIDKAIELGASCIVCERLPEETNHDVSYVVVEHSSTALGQMASLYHGNPSSKLKLVGVTGTNGKTTVATLLFNLFRKMGFKTGLLSTVENKINDSVYPSTHTTPDAINLNKMLAEMVEQGCSYCFMEVSSHAIHQKRIEGLEFKLAAFTNITHDHLDYHETFANYRDVKKQLFDGLGPDAFALTNKDDKNGAVMLQNTKAGRYSYSLHSSSDFKARIIEHDFSGMLLEIDGKEAWYHLVGKFNAYNLLTVYATAFLLGLEPDHIITSLTSLSAVSGRFEYLRTESGLIGVVDYAHTPDALQNVLETINAIRSKNEQLVTVVGCGGNRDHEKRPIMAKVATELSDRVILTSDNPRNENPEAILADMQTGIPAQHFKKVLKISNREEAIKTAISLANPRDIILIAGKGHENYQEIKGVKHPFDDKETFIKNATLLS